jgi:hypothetical protein
MAVSATPVNNWNFLQWYTVTGTTTATLENIAFTKYGQFDQIDYELPFKEGDEMDFYINFNSAISNSGFANWKLGLIDCQKTLIYTDLATLQQDTIAGTSSYYVYCEMDWPIVPKIGLFQLIIWDSSDNSVKYVSNYLRKISAEKANTDTLQLVYRNSSNVFNFQYESATGFYNKFRIPAWIRQAQPSDEVIGYDLSDGRFLPVRSEVKVTDLIITDGDKYFHEGFFAATRHHDYLRINNVNYERGSGADYTVTPPENGFPIYEAEIRLYQKDLAASYEIQ